MSDDKMKGEGGSSQTSGSKATRRRSLKRPGAPPPPPPPGTTGQPIGCEPEAALGPTAEADIGNTATAEVDALNNNKSKNSKHSSKRRSKSTFYVGVDNAELGPGDVPPPLAGDVIDDVADGVFRPRLPSATFYVSLDGAAGAPTLTAEGALESGQTQKETPASDEEHDAADSDEAFLGSAEDSCDPDKPDGMWKARTQGAAPGVKRGAGDLSPTLGNNAFKAQLKGCQPLPPSSRGTGAATSRVPTSPVGSKGAPGKLKVKWIAPSGPSVNLAKNPRPTANPAREFRPTANPVTDSRPTANPAKDSRPTANPAKDSRPAANMGEQLSSEDNNAHSSGNDMDSPGDGSGPVAPTRVRKARMQLTEILARKMGDDGTGSSGEETTTVSPPKLIARKLPKAPGVTKRPSQKEGGGSAEEGSGRAGVPSKVSDRKEGISPRDRVDVTVKGAAGSGHVSRKLPSPHKAGDVGKSGGGVATGGAAGGDPGPSSPKAATGAGAGVGRKLPLPPKPASGKPSLSQLKQSSGGSLDGDKNPGGVKPGVMNPAPVPKPKPKSVLQKPWTKTSPPAKDLGTTAPGTKPLPLKPKPKISVKTAATPGGSSPGGDKTPSPAPTPLSADTDIARVSSDSSSLPRKRIGSVGQSFTTEDLDICSKDAATSCRQTEKRAEPSAGGADSDGGASTSAVEGLQRPGGASRRLLPDDRAKKRRSKSLGAPNFIFDKLKPALKPNIPAKPKQLHHKLFKGDKSSSSSCESLERGHNAQMLADAVVTESTPDNPDPLSLGANGQTPGEDAAGWLKDQAAALNTSGESIPGCDSDVYESYEFTKDEGVGNTSAPHKMSKASRLAVHSLFPPSLSSEVPSGPAGSVLGKREHIYEDIDEEEEDEKQKQQEEADKKQKEEEQKTAASKVERSESRKASGKVSRKVSRKASRRKQRGFRQNVYANVEAGEGGLVESIEEEADDIYFSETDSDFSDDDFTDSEFEEELKNTISVGRGSGEEGREDEKGEKKTKLFYTANEILMTERSYVEKLRLVDQVFHREVLRENREWHFFPDEVIPQIFANIKSIYMFHNDFLLPQLEKKMAEWDEDPRIGEVMQKFAPFLIMYTEYVQNFDCAMTTFDNWVEKSARFSSIVDTIQKTPECGSLTLQHHMLSPIQRVPRYEMLLQGYLKHLPEDSCDRKDTEKALDLVTKAATHTNDTMNKNASFFKLLQLSEALGGTIDLVSPSRELVKQGPVIRISARDGALLDRYGFLFNDMLLVCMPKLGLKQQYKLKAKVQIEGMVVMEGDNPETPNTFVVKSKKQNIEFHFRSIDDKTEWQTALWNVIREFNKKQMSRQAEFSLAHSMKEDQLGKQAPMWVKDQDVSMCQICSHMFSMFFRRHHCRACGRVVCKVCSSRKTRLEFDDNNWHRVCDLCYNKLEFKVKPGRFEELTGKFGKKKKGVLNVKATDPALLSAYLLMTTDKKSWDRRWFALHDDFVLYSFKARQDVVAMTSMPLPGFSINPEIDEVEGKCIFNLFHNGLKKTYWFQTDDKSSLERWVNVLRKLVKAELPDSSLTSGGKTSVPTTPATSPRVSSAAGPFERSLAEDATDSNSDP